MKTIYEKVEAKGIRIPIEICKLADISDDVIIRLYKGKIEIQPQIISREEAERMANKYLIMHVGDGLIAKEPVLIEGKWRVSVVYSHSKKPAGVLYLDGETGVVVDTQVPFVLGKFSESVILKEAIWTDSFSHETHFKLVDERVEV